MPLTLPRFDDFASRLSIPPRARATVPDDPYARLTPEQRAAVDLQADMNERQRELAEQPRGAFGEIGAGVMRGATSELPRMIGQTLQAPNQTGPLYSIGDKLTGYAARKNIEYAEDLNPDAHNAVTSAFAGGAAMLAPSLAPLAALPVAAALGAPAGVAAGIAGVAGGAMFGASQFQDTYEKAIKAGKTPEEARSLGYQTGAVEGLGETAGTYVGGKFIKGALPRVLGKKYGVDEALANIRNPQFIKSFARDIGEVAAVETGTEVGQNFGEAAIEQHAGIDTTDPYKAAASAIGPTLALTAILGPLGALGLRSTMRRNQRALNALESPDASFAVKDAAVRELAPVMEPLVGKEAAQTWRMDQLVSASNAEAARRNDVQKTQDAQVEDALANPNASGVPRQTPLGEIPGMTPEPSHYTGTDNAQNVWDSLASQVGEREQVAKDAHDATFTPELNPPGKVLQDNTVRDTPPTAMQIAMENAVGKRKQDETAAAYAERYAAKQKTMPTVGAPAGPQGRVLTIEQQARVAAANKLADDAIAGKISGNTPVAHVDLMGAWRRAATAAGIDVSALRGQAAKRVEMAIKTAQGSKLWAGQIAALQKARDAMGKNTVSRDSMDAMIESFKTKSQPVKETSHEPTAESFQDPLSPEGAGQRDAETQRQGQSESALLTTPAAPVAGVAVPPPLAVTPVTGAAPVVANNAPVATPRPKVSAPTAAPPAAVVKPAPRPRTVASRGLLDNPVGVTSTGHEVAWGDFARSAPEGTITYDVAPGFKRVVGQEAARTRAARVGALVPVSEQRVAPDAYKFYFEQRHYDPRKPRGDSANRTWVLDYMRARNLAAGRNELGVNVAWGATERVDAAKMQASAQGALDWLAQYEGADVLAIADERVAQLGAIYDVNAKARETAAIAQKSITDSYEFAYRLKKAEEKGVHPDRVKLDANDMKEIERLAKADPGFEYLQAELPNYQRSEMLAQAIETGKLDRVLATLEENAPTEWVKYMAGVLRRLGLRTDINMSNKVAYNDKGERVYGRYFHLNDSVRIYLGGENAHTLLHEITHAGTVGRITYAEDAEKAATRTPEQAAAVASLQQLRALIAQVRKVDTRNQYAFKNEREFVAEVFSNERLQRWLSSKTVESRSLWQRVKDWLRELFGATPFEGDNAFESAMRFSVPFLQESRFGAARGMSFDHSLTGAAAQSDGVLSTLVKKWQSFAASHKNIGEAPATTRNALLSLSSTFNIAQMIDRIPSLRAMIPGVEKLMAASDLRTVVRQNKQLEFSSVTKPIQMVLAKLPLAQQRAMNAKLEEFAGEQSILGIDLNKNFDDNKAANKTLDPALKAQINQMHAEYRRLDPILRKAVEDSVRVFRKNYIQQTAVVLAANLRTYKDAQVAPYIAQLNILDATLKDGANPNARYYADAYSANLEKRIHAVFNGIRKDTAGQDESHLRTDVAEIEKFYKAAVGNPYHHLGRSGDYFMSFDVADGDAAWASVQQALAPFGKVVGVARERRHVFLRFENGAQRNAALEAVERLGVAQEMERGSLYDETSVVNLRGVPQAMRKVLRSVNEAFSGDEMAEVRQFLRRELLDMLPDSSAQKALAPRKSGGVAGYDADFVRNFSKRAEGMASMLANGVTMPMHDAAFKTMKDEVDKLRNADGTGAERAKTADSANAVLSELSKRFSNSLNPVDSPIIDRVKAAGYNFYLAVSPAFILTNLMQPYHLTLPYLGGRYGFVAAAKEMGKSSAKAFKLVKQAIDAGWAQGQAAGGTYGAIRGVLDLTLKFDGAGLSSGEIDVVKQLLASGQLDTTQGHELGQLASGQSPGWTTTMKLLSTGSHYSEVVNRLTTALATYNLDVSKGSRNDAVATARSIEAVRATQFDYSDHNTARALGRHGVAGKVTPLLASFQQYSFQTMELLFRMAHDALRGETAEDRTIAMKQLGGVLATTSIIAGTLGLPLANVIARVADGLLGSGDDPSDVKTAYRAWLAEVFGKDVAEAIARGLPRAVLGFDTSNRAGLADILPGSRFITDRRPIKDKLEGGALDMLGPAVSAGQDILTGIGKISDGQVMEGLLQATPLALRGPLKAIKMGETGYTTATGNKLPLEVTPWAVLTQAAGFTPSVKAEQSDVNFAFRQHDGLLKQRKTVLSNELYRAAEQGDDTTALLQTIAQFNAQNPQYKIDVAAGLTARAKARAVADTTGSDIAALPRYLPLLERYNFANTR